ncbi:MAG: NADP-dependent malic enzyme [Clostridia bacterium]
MDYKQKSIELHRQLKGKIEVISRVKIENSEALSTAYTPGVAEPCLQIKNNPELSYEFTRRGNLVAVVSDGSAVLGLGNIGGLAGMPVMEGKAILFKEFADIDAFPICLNTQNTNEIISIVKALSISFGGINLEDISSPRCFEIERQLIDVCDIPVFHDDQHGTAIVVLAGLINALKLVKKNAENIKVVISGPGAAGTAISKLIYNFGCKNIVMCDEFGILYPNRKNMEWHKKEMAELYNSIGIKGNLSDALIGADVFIGVSAPNILNEAMVKSMNKDAIIFAMANPTPEIMPDVAKSYGAKVIGTGRSDFPNQVNNVLAFPGVFRGALDAKATKISEGMKLAAALAIANLIKDDELTENYIIPKPFDKRVVQAVSTAVRAQAEREGVVRI